MNLFSFLSKISTKISKGQHGPRVRFAPSPTGVLHIGGARTALFNYLFAKQNNGKFILRIEDTDIERSKPEFEKDILNGLLWLNLQWDEIYKQSERTEIYKSYIEKLLEEGKAYISKETEGERESVIRLKNHGKKVKFNDLIRGEIEFDTTELGDFVIAKDQQTPLYHLAVVVDDIEMKITHVIRGEDHISNTPRQILIQEAIGYKPPEYAHIPLILGSDRSKLSKRHGATSVFEYKQMGYLPESIINFIAFLGWNPGTEKEIYNIKELIKDFSIEKIQKGGAILNMERLDWINNQYIKKMNIDELTEKCLPFFKKELNKEKIKKIVKIKQDRMNKLTELNEEIEYFFNTPNYEKEMLLWKQETDLSISKKHLEKIVGLLNNLDENKFTSDNIKSAVWNYAEEQGKGNVLWPFRVSLTGLQKSPDPFSIANVLGKEETLKRLKQAIDML